MSRKFNSNGNAAWYMLREAFNKSPRLKQALLRNAQQKPGSHWAIQATHEDWVVTFDFSMAGDLSVSVVCPRKPPSGRGASIEMVMYDLDIRDVMQFVRLATCVVEETP